MKFVYRTTFSIVKNESWKKMSNSLVKLLKKKVWLVEHESTKAVDWDVKHQAYKQKLAEARELSSRTDAQPIQ